VDDTQTCFGCGKEIETYHGSKYAMVEIAGEIRYFCAGREAGSVKKPCYLNAMWSMYQNHACTICGEYAGFNRTTCEPCEKKLNFAEEYAGKPLEAQRNAIEAIIHALSNFTGYGEYNYGRSNPWPFSLLKHIEQKTARAILTCLRDLWKIDVSEAKHEGYLEGSDLLQGLHTGDKSLNEFSDSRESTVRRMRNDEKERKELITQLYELVKSIQED